LTGDIDLNHNYNELATHYSSCFDTVSLSQIPHHGAGKNWERQILDDLEKCKHWVSSSGCPSFYGHPHSIVALDVLSDKRCFCWSNHHDRFYVEGGVTW
jgi:beta-lactamase superfamily II metal-dependent hydrolase